ncbi:MAG: MG2 domain-containing protein [Leptospiraceae bacterium]|nr:MG2 domain-containing protein [Leptospiraceae bacterium]
MKNLILLVLTFLLFQNGCKKKEIPPQPSYKSEFRVDVPGDIPVFDYTYHRTISFNYHEVNLEKAINAIKFEPEAKTLEIDDYSKKSNVRNISLRYWELKPNTSYTVTVNSFEDTNSEKLINPGKFTLDIGPMTRKFSIENVNSLQTIESEQKQLLPINVSEIADFKLEVAKFEIKDIINHHSRKEKSYKSFYSSLNFKKAEWKNKTKKEWGTIGFNLKPYLNNKKGFVAVRLSGKEDSYEYIEKEGKSKIITSDITLGTLVQSTDLNLIVKEDFEKSLIWVNSLSKGTPVNSVRVRFYSNGNLNDECTTNADGFCSIKKNTEGFSDFEFFFASLNETDEAFLITKDHEISSHYGYKDAYLSRIKASLFFDRKLYRPGDTVQVKALLTNVVKGELTPYQGPVTATVYDSQNSKLITKSLNSTSEGGVWFSYPISSDGKLGHYTVSLTGKNLSESNTFQVEEFKPAAFAVTQKEISKKSNKKQIQIHAEYLFGAPLRSAEVKYTIYKSEEQTDRYIAKWPKYLFGHYDYDVYNSNYGDSNKENLDETGNLSIELDTSPLKKEFSTKGDSISYAVPIGHRVEASVKDKDQKVITNTMTYKPEPMGKFLIGISSKENYRKVKDKFSFDLVTIDHNGNPVKGQSVEAFVIHEKWITIKENGVNSYYPRYELEKNIIEKKTISLSEHEGKFEFIPEKEGGYKILFREKGGNNLSSIHCYAYQEDFYSSWNYRTDNSVELEADKQVYEVGDEAKILIKSPYKESRVLVTLEREKIFWHKEFDLKSNSVPISIPLNEEQIPNATVNVVVFRPRLAPPKGLSDSEKENYIKEDLGLPEMKTGSIKLSLSLKSKLAKLDVKTNKQLYSTGDKVRIEIKTEPNAELAVSVADRGVLDLIGYSYSNPTANLYSAFREGGFLYSILATLIKQYQFEPKGSSPGGDYGDDSWGKGGFGFDSEDGARKNFQYTAFWKPDIIADGEGNAVLEFNLPDNLTTFRVMTVASKLGKYNATNVEFKVRKPLVVQGVLPRFIRNGDNLEIGGLIINETGMDTNYKVTLDAEDFDTQTKEKVVSIPKNKSIEVNFPVKITENALSKKIINPKLIFKGSITAEPVDPSMLLKEFSNKDIRDKLYFEIPFKEASTAVAFAESGFTDSKTQVNLNFPKKDEIVNNQGEFNIQLSNSVLFGLEKAFHFYAANPYMCMEQRSSAYLLAISSGALLKDLAVKPPSDDSYDFNNIDKLFTQEMSEFQNEDGSFRLWKPESSSAYPYLTSYVVLVSRLAKEQGKKINNDAYNKALNYLANYQTSSKENEQDSLESLALVYYVLAQEGREVSSIEKTLLSKVSSLTLRSLSYLAIAYASKNKITDYNKDPNLIKIIQDVIKRFEFKNNIVTIIPMNYDQFYRSYYSKAISYASLLRTLLRFEPKHPAIVSIVKKALIERKDYFWSDAHSTGLLALAIKEYRDKFELTANDFKIQFQLGSKTLASPNFPANTPTVWQEKYSWNSLSFMETSSVPMTIEKLSPKGRGYFSTSFIYQPKKEKLDPIANEISIERSITDSSGNEWKEGKSFKRGEIYTIKLSVDLNNPGANLMVVDRIPSNFEIVNKKFLTEGALPTGEDTTTTNYYEDPTMIPAYTEFRDDKALFSRDYIRGFQVFEYMIRPVVKGESVFPSSEAFLMYKPSTFSKSKGYKIKVE